jgi:hypothetical protein
MTDLQLLGMILENINYKKIILTKHGLKPLAQTPLHIFIEK